MADGAAWGQFHASLTIFTPETVRRFVENAMPIKVMGLPGERKRMLLDLVRNGSWSYAREYSVQMIADWKCRNGNEPLPEPSDPRWVQHVDRHFCDYLRKFSARCHAAGVEFIVGMTDIDGREDAKFKRLLGGFDWKSLAAEGVFDAIWVMSVPMDKARPFESTERIYRDIMTVRDKAKVYFPLPAYDYAQTSVYSYAKFAKISAGEAAKRLLKLAKEAGGCGVVMECVDYRNYTPEVCAAIGEFLR